MIEAIRTRLAAAALLLAATVAPAGAVPTIYFAGGEDSSFTFIGTATVLGANTYVRSAYARTSVYALNTGTSDPPANRIQSPTFTSTAGLWIHAQFGAFSFGSSNLNTQGLLVRSPDGVVRMMIRQTATPGVWKVATRNAAGTITDIGTTSALLTPLVTPTQLDWHIDYTCSGSGNTQLYIGSVQVLTFTGNLCTDAATQLNQIDLAGLVTVENTQWSEIIASDSDTRSMALWTLQPVAAGNTQSWTPSTVGNINDWSDATFISDGTGNVLSQWTTPTSAPAGIYSVRAIVQEARVRKGASGPTGFDWSVRTASTNFLGGATNPLTTGFLPYSNFIWATNPNTSAAWAISDITTGFNLGIKSLP